MASKEVREWFRAEVVARVPTVPFYETINEDRNHKGRPNVWCTLEFNGASEQRVSLGRRACFREFGEVNVIVLGKSGYGDDAVLDAAKLFRNQFHNVRVTVPLDGGEVGYLVLDAFDPPNTDISENGDWFLASLAGSYAFDTVRG